MVSQIIATVILSGVCAVTYRMGGSGNYPRWYRLAGGAICMSLTAIIWGFLTWWLVLCIPLLIGALSTYWKKKGTEAKWYNWAFTGFGYSCALLPLAIQYHLYIPWIVFSVVMTAAITLWSVLIGKDVLEECGRGAILILTLLILGISKKGGKK